MVSVLCNHDENIENEIQEYFNLHDLETEEEAERLRQRRIYLSDVLCLDYKNNPQYKAEADASKPNNTPSRKDILRDNDMLYDGKKINEIFVNTVTTKQDRNPNSGLITYHNYARKKTKWRYLTPRECFKLMGFDEKDFERVIQDNPRVTRNRNLYSTEKLIKLAGNSIVVDVLEAIFQQIMEINIEILGERE